MYQDKILVRQLGLQPYEPISQAMHEFTDTRDDSTLDEIWLVEHYPVFTQGQAGKAEHILMPGDIPVIPERSRWAGDLSRAGATGDVCVA
ncbi:lipoate-protein ligase B [Escherichia coli]|nr:lipoate-protein ligase B [Escherichia coli]